MPRRRRSPPESRWTTALTPVTPYDERFAAPGQHFMACGRPLATARPNLNPPDGHSVVEFRHASIPVDPSVLAARIASMTNDRFSIVSRPKMLLEESLRAVCRHMGPIGKPISAAGRLFMPNTVRLDTVTRTGKTHRSLPAPSLCPLCLCVFLSLLPTDSTSFPGIAVSTQNGKLDVV